MRAIGITGQERYQYGSVNNDVDFVVTRRKRPLFQTEIDLRSDEIADRLRRRRILIIGGAGSIGSATTRLVVDYGPAAVHVIDQNENYLAELVRFLRSRPQGLPNVEFRALPLDYGSPIMHRFLQEADRSYDIVMNFAALKHVRSEKDIYSVLQMLDTNLVRHARFKRWLSESRHGSSYFAVSTDKAANPTSIMGASKRLMEDLVFGLWAEQAKETTSARFANVAFSNGSLLEGFLRRLAAGQPLAVPRNVSRYFFSETEAGQLCLIAALLIPDRHIAIPHLNPVRELQKLEEIAARLLEHFGWEPQFYDDEQRARANVPSIAAKGRWPVLLTALDTSGEKPYEEFVGEGEVAIETGMPAIRAVRHVPSRALDCGLLDRLARMVEDPDAAADKRQIVDEIRAALVRFGHVDSERNLDERI
jgi:FlaA1/EpsC-like NDP-sugar epimerase